MAATIVKSATNAGSVAFGAATTISAGLVTSASHSRSIEKSTAMDADGDIVAVGYYGASETLELSGTTNGTISATLGAALTLTGAPTGVWLAESFSEESTAEGFKTFSLSATRYASTES